MSTTPAYELDETGSHQLFSTFARGWHVRLGAPLPGFSQQPHSGLPAGGFNIAAVPRRLLIPILALVALVVLGGGAVGYVYFFSGLRTSPPALSFASPSPATSAAVSPSPTSTTTSGFAGVWQIGSGSLAGYRVREQFAGQTSTHDAVARTSSVTGQLTITQSGSSYQLAGGTVTVQLSGLASVDSVAGYNVTNRDRIVQQSLDVSSFPTAVFEAQSVTLPAGAETGQAVTVSVPGKLTVRGVTKDVTATLQ